MNDKEESLCEVAEGRLVATGVSGNLPIDALSPEALILHHGRIGRDEIEDRQGFRVTPLIRAAADLLAESSVSLDHLRQALREDLKRGVSTRAEIDGHAQRQMLK